MEPAVQPCPSGSLSRRGSKAITGCCMPPPDFEEVQGRVAAGTCCLCQRSVGCFRSAGDCPRCATMCIECSGSVSARCGCVCPEVVLPDDILVLVFGFLTSFQRLGAMRVNRQWQRCARDPSLWRHVDVSSSHLTDDQLVRCVSYSRTLTSLNIAGCPRLSNKVFERIGSHCNALAHLNYSGGSFEALAYLSPACTSLSSLVLQRPQCGSVTSPVFRASLLRLLRNNTNIERLDLGHTTELDDFTLGAIAIALPHLRHLHLRGCSNLTDHGLAVLLHSCGQGLAYLSVRGCLCLTDYLVQRISESCPLLVHLDIREINAQDLRLGNPQTAFSARFGFELDLSPLEAGCPHLMWVDAPTLSPPSLKWELYDADSGWRFRRT